jgi:hypothetical protein
MQQVLRFLLPVHRVTIKTNLQSFIRYIMYFLVKVNTLVLLFVVLDLGLRKGGTSSGMTCFCNMGQLSLDMCKTHLQPRVAHVVNRSQNGATQVTPRKRHSVNFASLQTFLKMFKKYVLLNYYCLQLLDLQKKRV